MININNSNDISYRYQMERVSIKYCNNNNNKYTVINNMKEVANAINTPSEIIYKFISFSCGSSRTRIGFQF